MSGLGRSPLKVVPRNALIGAIGGFAVIGLLALLSDLTPCIWMMAPFGATCVLAFGVWDAPLSQPRNIVGGHLISTLVGLTCCHLFGQSNWVLAIAVGLAIGLMMLTKTTHPPAGADPLVVILSGSGWSFLVAPVLIGSALIVLVAVILNNLDKNRRYPTFWF
ncbi:HPP family protein [Paenibacillus glycinis]|uniref:HPP family protein n=1 Tax=Paenibacillus glycinis TaxID=2697035 RepID=A0ABW9XQP9_9BACL|nr:HPP family protein [Paenibacillus glycinis]NBD24704.1 HPP family protein [Paenibacillus glycinis]